MVHAEINLNDTGYYHFDLYYSKNRIGVSGLNIELAKSGFSISNLCLSKKDVDVLDAWLAANNIVGEYKYTKNKIWVRCQNLLSVDIMVKLTRHLRSINAKFGK